MKTPKKATLLLGKNQKYEIDIIHHSTGQVTLKEKPKVYNTVSIKNVIFDFAGFSDVEIARFLELFVE